MPRVIVVILMSFGCVGVMFDRIVCVRGSCLNTDFGHDVWVGYLSKKVRSKLQRKLVDTYNGSQSLTERSNYKRQPR